MYNPIFFSIPCSKRIIRTGDIADFKVTTRNAKFYGSIRTKNSNFITATEGFYNEEEAFKALQELLVLNGLHFEWNPFMPMQGTQRFSQNVDWDLRTPESEVCRCDYKTVGTNGRCNGCGGAL